MFGLEKVDFDKDSEGALPWASREIKKSGKELNESLDDINSYIVSGAGAGKLYNTVESIPREDIPFYSQRKLGWDDIKLARKDFESDLARMEELKVTWDKMGSLGLKNISNEEWEPIRDELKELMKKWYGRYPSFETMGNYTGAFSVQPPDSNSVSIAYGALRRSEKEYEKLAKDYEKQKIKYENKVEKTKKK